MPANLDIQTVEIEMPARGLFSALPGPFINERFSPAGGNVRFYGGEVRNRPGLVDHPSTPQDVGHVPIGGAGFTTSTGLFRSLIALPDDLMWYNPATSLWTSVIGSCTLAGTSSQPFIITNALGYAVAVNGNNDPCYWDGITASYTQITASYPSRYAVGFANRLVLGYMLESPTVVDRVRWCAYGDITTWNPATDPTAGYVDLVDTPGEITGMHALGGYGYVFKRNSCARLTETGYTLPAFSIQDPIPSVPGCLEGRTLVEIRGNLYWLGPEDVYRWDGSSLPSPIGGRIRNELFPALNRGRVRQAFAFHNEHFNEYWLCIPVGTATDATTEEAWAARAYIYNYVEDTWGTASGLYFCASYTRSTSSDVTLINDISWDIDDWTSPIDGALAGEAVQFPLVGTAENLSSSPPDGYMLRLNEDTAEDAGASFDSFFETADKRFYNPQTSRPQYYTVNRVHVGVRERGTVNYTAEFSADSGKSWTSLGTVATSGAATNAYTLLSFDARVTSHQGRVRVTCDGAMAVQAVILELIERGGLR
jgi:hypothetical protein